VAHDRRNSPGYLPDARPIHPPRSDPTTDTNVESTDISLGGAGLELFGPAPLERAGIRVEFRSDMLPRDCTLGARPPHAAEHRHGRTPRRRVARTHTLATHHAQRDSETDIPPRVVSRSSQSPKRGVKSLLVCAVLGGKRYDFRACRFAIPDARVPQKKGANGPGRLDPCTECSTDPHAQEALSSCRAVSLRR